MVLRPAIALLRGQPSQTSKFPNNFGILTIMEQSFLEFVRPVTHNFTFAATLWFTAP